MLLRAFHANGDVAAAKVVRRGAPRLRQREKRIGHQVLGIARCHVLARQCAEQVELFALLQGMPWWAGHGDGHRRCADQRARLSAEWCSAYSGSEVVSKLRVSDRKSTRLNSSH